MDPEWPASKKYPTVYHAAYVMLHGLVDVVVTCFYVLKIASDSDFYLLLEKTTVKPV